MGFCDENQYNLFMNQVNNFEKMLIDDGVELIKLWFSISKEEQKARFVARLSNPLKTWKFSNVDLEGQKRWEILYQIQRGNVQKNGLQTCSMENYR